MILKRNTGCLMASVLLVIVFVSTTATAEFYQYTDKNGNLVFTDDLSRVPENLRENTKKFNSIQTEEGTSETQMEAFEPKERENESVYDKRENLENEYFRLQEARRRLMQEKNQVTNIEEQKIYNEKVNQLNQEIDFFSRQIDNFNETHSNDNKEVGPE